MRVSWDEAPVEPKLSDQFGLARVQENRTAHLLAKRPARSGQIPRFRGEQAE